LTSAFSHLLPRRQIIHVAIWIVSVGIAGLFASPAAAQTGLQATSEITTDTLSWGPVKQGIRIALELIPRKMNYDLGESVSACLYVQNMDAQQLSMEYLHFEQQRAAVTEDGKVVVSILFSGPYVGSNRRSIILLNPGEIHDFECRELVLGEVAGQRRSLNGARIIPELLPGLYRLRYRTSNIFHVAPSDKVKSDTRNLYSNFPGLENLETGEIPLAIQAPDPRSPRLIWGPPSNGLRGALELVPALQEYPWDQAIGARIHLQNISDHELLQRLDRQDAGWNHRAQFLPGNNPQIMTLPIQATRKLEDQPLQPGQSQSFDVPTLIFKKPIQPNAQNPLALPPGTSTAPIHLSYQMIQGKDPDHPDAWFGRIETGVLEVAIKPDHPSVQPSAADLASVVITDPKATPLAWGNAVHGIRTALEILPHQKDYAIGQFVGLRVHVRNENPDPVQIDFTGPRRDKIQLTPQRTIRISSELSSDTTSDYPIPITRGIDRFDTAVLETNESHSFELLGLKLEASAGLQLPTDKTRSLAGLSPGLYTMRFHTTAMLAKSSPTGIKIYDRHGLEPLGDLVAGDVKLSIQQPPRNAGKLVWGVPANGLRAGAEFTQHSLTRYIPVRIYIQNIGDRPRWVRFKGWFMLNVLDIRGVRMPVTGNTVPVPGNTKLIPGLVKGLDLDLGTLDPGAIASFEMPTLIPTQASRSSIVSFLHALAPSLFPDRTPVGWTVGARPGKYRVSYTLDETPGTTPPNWSGQVDTAPVDITVH
jgi:hypothetical protein